MPGIRVVNTAQLPVVASLNSASHSPFHLCLSAAYLDIPVTSTPRRRAREILNSCSQLQEERRVGGEGREARKNQYFKRGDNFAKSVQVNQSRGLQPWLELHWNQRESFLWFKRALKNQAQRKEKIERRENSEGGRHYRPEEGSNEVSKVSWVKKKWKKTRGEMERGRRK